MPNPRLRPDTDIKRAVARFLKRLWQSPEIEHGHNERLALREICLPCDSEDIASIRDRLPKTDPAGLEVNYLLSDVIVFCPMACPGWQARAKMILEEHVLYWREELIKVQKALIGQKMYAVPFGRFLNTQEGPDNWVSPVKTLSLANGEVFGNCEAAGISPHEKSDIWYYSRPYIVWPNVSGELRHFTRVNGHMVVITRPELKHRRLQQGEAQVATAG